VERVNYKGAKVERRDWGFPENLPHKGAVRNRQRGGGGRGGSSGNQIGARKRLEKGVKRRVSKRETVIQSFHNVLE